MKKILLIFVIFSITIIFFGCNKQNTISTMSYEIDEYEVNDYSDANMVVLDDSISSKGLTLEFNYYGDDAGQYGAWYTLFIYEDGEWNELSYIIEENVGWNLWACIVERNQANKASIDWEWLYGELSTGRYLIVKEFTNYRGPGDFDDYYFADEFTIQ